MPLFQTTGWTVCATSQTLQNVEMKRTRAAKYTYPAAEVTPLHIWNEFWNSGWIALSFVTSIHTLNSACKDEFQMIGIVLCHWIWAIPYLHWHVAPNESNNQVQCVDKTSLSGSLNSSAQSRCLVSLIRPTRLCRLLVRHSGGMLSCSVWVI